MWSYRYQQARFLHSLETRPKYENQFSRLMGERELLVICHQCGTKSDEKYTLNNPSRTLFTTSSFFPNTKSHQENHGQKQKKMGYNRVQFRKLGQYLPKTGKKKSLHASSALIFKATFTYSVTNSISSLNIKYSLSQKQMLSWS